jgi:hypothetical protein
MVAVKRLSSLFFLLLVLMLTGSLAAQAERDGSAVDGGVVGEGTPASCTEDALNAALNDGGGVPFNCGALPVSAAQTIS